MRSFEDVAGVQTFKYRQSSLVPLGGHASRRESIGLTDPLPFCHRLRRAPSQISNRRRRERNALVHGQSIFHDALNLAALDPGGAGVSGSAGAAAENRATTQRAAEVNRSKLLAMTPGTYHNSFIPN